MTKKKITPEMVDRMRELRGLGWILVDIAREVGKEFGVEITHPSVIYHLTPGGTGEANKRRRGYQKEFYRKLYANAATIVGRGHLNCVKCEIDNLRILCINHLNGDGRKDLEKHSGKYRFYRAIVNGIRPIYDLNLLCRNHNILYEFEAGRRNVGSRGYNLRVSAIEKLAGEHPTCAGCGNIDLRVLEINHLKGDGKKDWEKYGGRSRFHRAITDGTYPAHGLKNLDIRCGNCNWLYEPPSTEDEISEPELLSIQSRFDQIRSKIGRQNIAQGGR